MDTWVSSIFDYSSNHTVNNDRLRVGGFGDEYDAFIRFDLSGLPSITSSAQLYLFSFPAGGDSKPVSMGLARVTSDWSETAAWPPPSSFPVAIIPAPLPGWYTIDITALYNGWQSGLFPNFGIELRPTGNSNEFNNFYSSDFIADTALRPKLVVVVEEGTPTTSPTPTHTPTTTRTTTPTPTVRPTPSCPACRQLGYLSVLSPSIYPPLPIVGDPVTFTFPVYYALPGGISCEGGDGQYCLFTQTFTDTTLFEGGTFSREANSIVVRTTAINTGVTTVQLRVGARTENECYYPQPDGSCQRYFDFVPIEAASSPIEVVVRDIGAPTATPTETATPTCAPTGTPYCSDECGPGPTPAPGCFYPGGGPCRQNPQCAVDERCLPRSFDPFSRCCSCVKVTPTPTPTPKPRVGDCNGDGAITGTELANVIRIALGAMAIGECGNVNCDTDSDVTIEELVMVVNASPDGCVVPVDVSNRGPERRP